MASSTCPAAIRQLILRSASGAAKPVSGSIVELDAKTGAYKGHFETVPKDWHVLGRVRRAGSHIHRFRQEGVVRSAEGWPSLCHHLASQQQMVFAFPLPRSITRSAVRTRQGSAFVHRLHGGRRVEWPRLRPRNDLVMVGEVQWCTTVTAEPKVPRGKGRGGKAVVGASIDGPLQRLGQDRSGCLDWAGWVYAIPRRDRRMALAGKVECSGAERC